MRGGFSAKSSQAGSVAEALEGRLLLCDAVAASGGAAAAAAVPANWATTEKRLLYLVVAFSDQPLATDTTAPQDSRAPDPAVQRANVTAVDAFLRANSFNATGVAAASTVTDVIRLSKPATGYADWNAVLAEAKSRVPTVDASGGPLYDLFSVRYNGGPGFFAGSANILGPNSAVKTDAPNTLAHELGHNFGAQHANGWIATDPDTVTGPGRNGEYGNRFDVMGTPHPADVPDWRARHLNVNYKYRIGWIGNDNVTAVASSGQYPLYPFDVGGARVANRPYALQIARVDRSYYVGFRQAAGWSGNPSVFNGVEIGWSQWGTSGETTPTGSNSGTQVLDVATARTGAEKLADPFINAALTIGRTYTDETAGVHVTPLAKRPDGGLDVRINFFNGANQAPSASIDASTDSVSIGAPPALSEPVTFTAAASDADSDALAYAWDFGDGTFVDNGGVLNSPTVTKSWSGPGDYRVRLTVTDMKGRQTTVSRMVRVLPAVGTLNTQRVSGRVVDALGHPVSDVRIKPNVGTISAYSDADGAYTLVLPNSTSLESFGASKPGWAFGGGSGYIAIGPDTRGVDFRGTWAGFKISGVVTEGATPLAGVVVSDGVHAATTDAGGNYALPGATNGTYSLAFTKPNGDTFTRAVPVEFADATHNVDATGYVNGYLYGVPSQSASITVTDGMRNAEVYFFRTEDSLSVYYYFFPSSQPKFLFGTVTLTASGSDTSGQRFSFSPRQVGGVSQWTNPLPVDGDEPNTDFARDTVTTSVVRGRVTDASGLPVDGAILSAGTKSSVTDSDGRYAVLGLANGTYTLTPSKAGHTFTPASLSATVNNADVGGQNFSAARPPVTPTAPQITTAAAAGGAGPNPNTGVQLTVVASDGDKGEARLKYTWSKISSTPADGAVTFGAAGSAPGVKNGTNSAKSIVATFSKAGTYQLRVTADDGETPAGSLPTSDVTVVVTPSLTRIRVRARNGTDATSVTVPGGTAVEFSADAIDQFALTMSPAPAPAAVTWAGSPAPTTGLVDPFGVYTAPLNSGNLRHSILASVAGVTGSATATVSANATLGSAVAGRRLFYNFSSWDGSTATVDGANDDAAIATDKAALLPGQTATPTNFTSYEKGINGVMVDLPQFTGTPSLSDFALRVGTDQAFTSWAVAPTPTLAVRDVTVDGVPTKRVTLTWADRSIVNQWLRVAVLPTTRTRVALQDVFYFGNLIGESYFSVAYGQWRVGTIDTNATKANYGTALIDNLYDFNRDGIVNIGDEDISKANWNMVLTVLSAPV